MNRQRIRVIALAALVVAAGAYVWAQRTAGTVKPAPTATAAVKKPGAVVPGAKPNAPAANAKAGAPVVPASKGTAPPNAAVPPKTAAPVSVATANVPAKVLPASAKPAAVPPAAAAPLPTAVPLEATPWQDQLQKGAYLAEKIRPRLPEGTDLAAAANGFRDLQQFVAAVTAAHNLKVDFDELKRRVVTDKKGLASAIDAMKKVASATIEEQRAEYEARGLIQEAKRQPVPVAPVKAATTKTPPKKPAKT